MMLALQHLLMSIIIVTAHLEAISPEQGAVLVPEVGAWGVVDGDGVGEVGARRDGALGHIADAIVPGSHDSACETGG